jgi:hypothetical protein
MSKEIVAEGDYHVCMAKNGEITVSRDGECVCKTHDAGILAQIMIADLNSLVK